MKNSNALVSQEFGPFAEVDAVHGVTFDGEQVWFASGDAIHAMNPDTGEIARVIAVPADAGTAFDGRYLYQISEDRIHRIDPVSGARLSSIPAPGGGGDSGLAWADGSLWVGQYRARQIVQIDPDSGEILRTIKSDRFVTGVTWLGDELWHGTWEDDESGLRRVDPVTGEVRELLKMPERTGVSGLESDGVDRFFCGGGGAGKVRVVRRGQAA